MYIIEFLFWKAVRIGVPAAFWIAAVVVPVILAQLGVLDFALIEGRCFRPLARCGQDNVILIASGLGILCAAPAIAVTVISGMWLEEDWVRERERLRRKYQPAPTKEPTKPNIYED